MGNKRIKKRKGYEISHIGTYRYKCKRVWSEKKQNFGYPVSMTGNYESLLSFKELPPYSKFKKDGRAWEYSKNYAPVMDRIVLDIDCEDGLEKAFEVTKNIMEDLSPNNISEYTNIYFSGSKGFHIEILTDELDIIDITAKQPMNACNQYKEFLNYFENKYDEVDLSLKDIGTRILRRYKTKHEKTGNWKILADINADLPSIIESSKSKTDMVEPVTKSLDKDNALVLLNTFSKPIETDNNADNVETPVIDDSIYTLVYNDLNSNIHHKLILIGGGLNGYVDESELESIYQLLSRTTDIDESVNAKGSLFDGYRNDRKPCNLGQLYNHYSDNNIDPTNFYNLSAHLDSKIQLKSYGEFRDKLESYDNDWFKMLDEELFDYVDNTENVFKGIINGLSALFGYGSRFIVVNGGAEVGKSEYINTIKQLMPKFENLGSSTPASIRRRKPHSFDKTIVYLGDKGLKGKEDEEFKGLQEVFGGLITENEFIRDIIVGEKLMKFNLISDGLCVFYTEPYTNLRIFGAGDQYTTRSTFITVNPVKDGLKVFLQDNEDENPFYLMHNGYISYIIRNPIEMTITNKIKTALYNASKGSLRTAKYLLALFKSYCQYLRLETPTTDNVDAFLRTFRPKLDITEIEYMVYEKLYNNLKIITEDGDNDLDYLLHDDGSPLTDYMLLQIKERDKKSFFTAKQIKTYFRNDFKHNKNLKDTIDQIPEILNNLYNASYIERLDWQYNGQNVYYIPQNKDMGE